MSDKKIIAVMGATGAQGGGLVRAILSHPESGFVARAVTRDPNSEKAKALAVLGADVVPGDVDDIESLKRAFAGAYGVFGVTFFWDHFSPAKETQQAKNIADAAKATDVKHYIWSSFEDTRNFMPIDDPRMPTLHGKYKVPHFDAKGKVEPYLAQIGLPSTNLWTSFYWENLIFFGMGPQKGHDGTLMFVLPMGDKKLPGIAAEDIGKCAFGIFLRGGDFIGKTVGIAGEHVTGAEMAATLSKELGKTITHVSPPFEVYRGFGFPGADDISNMFQFKHDFQEQFVGARDLNVARSLNPGLNTFAQWVKENADRIPVPE
ncbi:MAG: NmrA/HSCARG family protein [bacterium]|nr:NmrA/HSCARG family protein [bacterium]